MSVQFNQGLLATVPVYWPPAGHLQLLFGVCDPEAPWAWEVKAVRSLLEADESS